MFPSVRCALAKVSTVSNIGIRHYRTRSTSSRKTTHDLLKIRNQRKKAKKQTTKLLRTIKDPQKPKKPDSAWTAFTKMQYEKVGLNPETGKKPLLKTLLPEWSQEWKQMSDAQKQSFKASVEDWQTWKVQNQLYYQSGRYKRWLQTARALKASKPTPNGYFLFVKEWQSTHTKEAGQKPGSRVSQAAQAWNELTEQQKQSYKSRAQANYQVWKQMVDQAE